MVFELMSTKPIHTSTENEISYFMMLISQIRITAVLNICPEAYNFSVAMKGAILLTAQSITSEWLMCPLTHWSKRFSVVKISALLIHITTGFFNHLRPGNLT